MGQADGVTVWVLIAWMGCGESTEQVLARDGDPVAGAVVYADYCAECHGAAGEGDEAPALQVSDATLEELADQILWGSGSMDGFADALTTRQLADVIAFVSQQLQQPAQP